MTTASVHAAMLNAFTTGLCMGLRFCFARQSLPGSATLLTTRLFASIWSFLRSDSEPGRHASKSRRGASESGSHASELRRPASEPGRCASESRWRTSEPGRCASEPRWRTSEPERCASESRRRTSESGRCASASRRCTTETGRWASQRRLHTAPSRRTVFPPRRHGFLAKRPAAGRERPLARRSRRAGEPLPSGPRSRPCARPPADFKAIPLEPRDLSVLRIHAACLARLARGCVAGGWFGRLGDHVEGRGAIVRVLLAALREARVGLRACHLLGR